MLKIGSVWKKEDLLSWKIAILGLAFNSECESLSLLKKNELRRDKKLLQFHFYVANWEFIKLILSFYSLKDDRGLFSNIKLVKI